MEATAAPAFLLLLAVAIISNTSLASTNGRCVNGFQCSDGKCKSALLECNGQPDCSDGSDEENCGDRCVNGFGCADGKCIPARWECDGLRQCSDGSDEAKCDELCPDGTFRCTGGGCKPAYWECDGRQHCSDESDEDNCDGRCINGFGCSDGMCIEARYKCDGLRDCSDGSDEDNSDCRSTVGCYEVRQGNLTWPATKGAGVELPAERCITEEGNLVTRECLGDYISGYYWGNKSGECSDQLSNRTQQLWSINQINSSSDAASLANLTDHGQSLSAADVYYTAKKMQSISSQSSVAPSNLKHIVETLNNMMEAEDKVIQQVQEDFNTSSTLLQALETISFNTKLPPSSTEPEVRRDSRLVSLARVNLMPNSSTIGYRSWRISEEEKEDANVIKKETKDDWQSSQVSIILPDNLTWQVAEDSILNGSKRVTNKVQIMFAIYRNSKLFVDHTTFPNHIVDGHVIQAAYGGRTITNLKQPVKIYFKTNSTGKCVFWDIVKNKRHGGWSTRGCSNMGSHGDHILCQCDHLTSFALLVTFDDSISGLHEAILSTVSVIGCVLSIVALLMVIVTFFMFKKWRSCLKNQIVVSLSSAIMISFIVFLGGIQQIFGFAMCRAAAVTLHYFILASFGWMLVEAVHLYLRLVKVFGVYIPWFMWKASVCAWGTPLVPIIIVLAYDPSLYDSDRDAENVICWMSSTAFNYSFLPPLAVTMGTNIVIFGIIIYSMTCGRVQIRSTQTEQQRRKAQLWMAISVFSLLGFTWVFGLLTFLYPSLVFSYLFCITNTTQGLSIFFIHVFRERDAQTLWRNCLSKGGRDLSASQNSTSLVTF